jgi:hypothetical protein
MNIKEATDWEIERAHRSPTGPPQQGRVRPIHVKFLRYNDRATTLKKAPMALKDNPFKTEGNARGNKVYITDDVTESVRKQRRKLMVLKRRIKADYPDRTVFIPPVVPAILLREDDSGKLVRMKPGDTWDHTPEVEDDAME